MLNLIVGKKGTGKTKILIESVNGALKESLGNVVCIEKGQKLRYDLKYNVKLINIEEYGVKGYDELFAFVAGISAANYDVTHIFLDGLFKICERDYTKMEVFFDRVAHLAGPNEINFVFTVSADLSELPESVKNYIS